MIAGDRIPVSAALTSFQGEHAPFPIGPYILASLLQCSVDLIFAMPNQNGTELHIELFRESIALPRHNLDQILQDLATDYAKHLKHYCLYTPLQWFNSYGFWQLEKIESDNLSY